MLDLEPATLELTRLLDAIDDGALRNPTPCPDYSVAALLDHIMGLTMAFTWAADKTPPPPNAPVPGESTPDALDPQWRSLLPQRLDDLQAAWRKAQAWDGMAEAGGVTMPADLAGLVALDEVVLHGWDLARSTRQKYMVDDRTAQAILGFTTESAKPEQADLRNNIFGPIVPIPHDADPFDRALGLAGRNPAWSPA